MGDRLWSFYVDTRDAYGFDHTYQFWAEDEMHAVEQCRDALDFEDDEITAVYMGDLGSIPA